jgi:hypothetical protein
LKRSPVRGSEKQVASTNLELLVLPQLVELGGCGGIERQDHELSQILFSLNQAFLSPKKFGAVVGLQ